MATDKRRKTPAQKAKTAAARIARAAGRRRLQLWAAAATAASSAGYPLNVALTITWTTLQTGDKRLGHILDIGTVERERRLWSELRMVAARAGVEWIATRAPEHDRTRGLHLHLAMHLPDSRAMRDALAVVEGLTGAPAVWCDLRGRTLRGGGRVTQGIVAMSACGGWLLQRHVPAGNGSGEHLAKYAAKGTGKAKVEGQHRLSNKLAARARVAMTQGKPIAARSRPISATTPHMVAKTNNGALRPLSGALRPIDKQSTEIKHGARR
jgi:hypothetical protein